MSDKTTANPDSLSSTEETSGAFRKRDKPPLIPLNSEEGQKFLKEFLGAQFELNHDLNNPLAGVVGYLELALVNSESIPERTLELLRNVEKCANRMDELIQEFVESKRRLQTAVDLGDVLTDEN